MHCEFLQWRTILDAAPRCELRLCSQPKGSVGEVTDRPRHRQLALQPLPPICRSGHRNNCRGTSDRCQPAAATEGWQTVIFLLGRGSSWQSGQGWKIPGVVAMVPPAASTLAASSARAGLWTWVSSTARVLCEPCWFSAASVVPGPHRAVASSASGWMMACDVCMSVTARGVSGAVHRIAAESPR